MISRARKRDANEPEIVVALRAADASVVLQVGKGEPDLLVGYLGETYLLEVKAPRGPQGGFAGRRGGPGEHRDLSPDQVAWWAAWKGRPPVVVRSIEEALAAIGAPR